MMLIPAVALAASLGLPNPAVSLRVLAQDGRMDKFVAAPRIMLPLEIIPDRPLPTAQVSGGSPATTAVKSAPPIAYEVAIPVLLKEKKVTLHVYSEHTSDLISQLQQQGIQIMINLSTFPEGGVVIDIDDKPESFAMTTLGEAMGGSFNNRGGIWVWNKLPAPMPFGGGFGGGGFSASAPAAMEWVKASDQPLKAVAPYREVVKRDAILNPGGQKSSKEVSVMIMDRKLSALDSEAALDSLDGAAGHLKLSASQHMTLKSRGYLKYSELSKYQKSLVPKVTTGGWLIINSIKIKG